MKRALIAALLFVGCGRGAEPSFADYEAPGATRITGELRTADDRVPLRGRIFLRDAAGNAIASSVADDAGAFSFTVEPAGTVSWVAVDDEGYAARGTWSLQPHGRNALGRVWLSASPAAPWLVLERGLGFEERLTSFTSDLSGDFEVSGDRAWVVGQNQLSGVQVLTGDMTSHASELPWSHSSGIVSPGRYLSQVPHLGNDRRADAPNCATLFVRVDHRTLAVWDTTRNQEVARYDFPNAPDLVHLGCDAQRATLMRSFKDENDGGVLSVERFENGQTLNVGRLALQPGERVVDRTNSVVLLRRTSGLGEELRLWWPAENRQQPFQSPRNSYSQGLEATGRTVWGTHFSDSFIGDPATGETTSLGDVTFSPSPKREWLLAYRRRYERATPSSKDYFTTGLELTRVNLATRAVERLPPLAPHVERALAKGVANFHGVLPTVFDDGSVAVVVQTDEGSWLCDARAGTASSFFPEAARSNQTFEVVRAGEFVVIIERLPEAGSLDRSELATFHVGRAGHSLRRRTFLSSTTGAVRLSGDHLVFSRRDPLTGRMQLSRLALDSP